MSIIDHCKLILRSMSLRDKFSSKLRLLSSSLRMMLVASRECARDVISSKIDETTKARTFEREERSLRRSTSTRSIREFHENSWESRSLNCRCSNVIWLTTLIFSDRRLEALDWAWYWWKCVRCFRSFAQTSSRRHHDRFSFFCEEEISRRRSKSCFVENRFRFEFCWKEEKENEEKKTRRKKSRKKKRRKKRKKKRKRRYWWWWLKKRWYQRSNHANRCQ